MNSVFVPSYATQYDGDTRGRRQTREAGFGRQSMDTGAKRSAKDNLASRMVLEDAGLLLSLMSSGMEPAVGAVAARRGRQAMGSFGQGRRHRGLE